MGIHPILRSRVTQTVNIEKPIKEGQIIQGKILKLYPNNKAHIQLGSQTMVAQLEAPLSVGERYHFQVESVGDVLRLKVIGERLKNSVQSNITELLQTLGLRANKGNISFAQQLIREKIPFNRTQLMQAFSLLGSVKNQADAQQVLKEMIIQRLPMTASVFQALNTTNTTELSHQMKAVIQQLSQHQNPTDLQRNLLNRLTEMSEMPQGNEMRMFTQIVEEINMNNTQLFDTLKVSGLIDKNIDFSTWKSQWQSFLNQHQISLSTLSNHQPLQGKIPFSINMNAVEQTFNNMLHSQVQLREVAQGIVRNWSTPINETVITNRPLSEQHFVQFNNELSQRMVPLLSHQQQEQIVRNLQNNPVQLRQILTMIQQYSMEQTYSNIEKVLPMITEQDPFINMPPQQKLLGQIRQMLLFSGITDENLLAQDIVTSQQHQTVKSMLIQVLQQGDPVGNERVQQLLHHINGLQLQSVQDMGHFIQASLVLPGEKLALNNDIYIEFESKKTEAGKINADYCRILFYLDLENLEETVVDMQIQKRLVSITIFNDHQTLKLQANQLQPTLKKGLESINYQLSKITIKPLEERSPNIKDQSTMDPLKSSYEGIEFRV